MEEMTLHIEGSNEGRKDSMHKNLWEVAKKEH